MLNHWRQRRFSGAGAAALGKAEQKHSLRRIVLIVAALGVAAIAYELFWPARIAPVGAPPAVPVTVAAVARQPMPVRLDTIGTVQTIANVSVKSRIDGVITDVLIQDGQYVKAGDVMFKLDDRAAKAQLEQYQAQRDNAKADVGPLQAAGGQGIRLAPAIRHGGGEPGHRSRPRSTTSPNAN